MRRRNQCRWCGFPSKLFPRLLIRDEGAGEELRRGAEGDGRTGFQFGVVRTSLAALPFFRGSRVDWRRCAVLMLDVISDWHLETPPAVIAIPIVTSTSLVRADGVLRMAPSTTTDRYPHGGSIHLQLRRCDATTGASGPEAGIMPAVQTAIDSAARPSADADAAQRPIWRNHTDAGTDRSPLGAHRDASDAPRDGSSSYRFLDTEFGHALSHTCDLTLTAVQRLGVSQIDLALCRDQAV